MVGPGGEQVGIVRTDDARKLAYEADLDLVEVAPKAKPPVAKIMDYGKFKYEQAQKARESRKNQQQTVVKEQKFRPKIDDHDYETKKGNVVRFLEKPTCSPPGPTKRTSGTRIRSLMRASALIVVLLD